MSEYFSWISLLPVLFVFPALPFISRRFPGVEVSKFSYGAATSGILLTFFGIWQGLIGFDIANSAESLPLLIDGLKTAFASSISGLTTSMVINIFFVKSESSQADDFDRVIDSLKDLQASIDTFTSRSSEMQTEALLSAINKLVSELELGINSETKETMTKFRTSVEFLREWQEKYVDEIKSVTEAMDQNAVVTVTTTEQLNRTNEVLAELRPVTEQIAQSIGWVRGALPSMRKKGIAPDQGEEDR